MHTEIEHEHPFIKKLAGR